MLDDFSVGDPFVSPTSDSLLIPIYDKVYDDPMILTISLEIFDNDHSGKRVYTIKKLERRNVLYAANFNVSEEDLRKFAAEFKTFLSMTSFGPEDECKKKKLNPL